MKLDAVVLGCLRGIGGASLLIAAGACGASAPAPAEQSTTPVVVAQPAPSAETPQPGQDPAQPEQDPDMLSACGRG